MDCKNAQRSMADLGSSRLSEPVAYEVQRHLSECSDCRVVQQRALRLQQLLAVKRHETPGAHYFENFLGEFHQRLAIATAPRPTVWQRVCARLHIEPVPQMRYGFAHALGVAFAVALMWRGIASTDLPVEIDRSMELDFTTTQLTASVVPTYHSTPRVVASVLPSRPEPTTPSGSALVGPALAIRDEFTAPRYVLDRIAVTPASHEAANIHF